ncbi:ATP-binding protein [Sphingomonas sp. SUN039]|uniref:sensor histidine kinase n=1 Tax=Sphingomonas sp. SUN039 TaxID=2937787 RepID=UPI0021640AB1|nr:ATP-binding protein [Sphingomonas sp. SUN039]UVO53758.1 ATP-binding protein [Sphingomonas sp. SUN039]
MPVFRTIRSGPFRLALLFAAIFAVGSILLVVAVETSVASYAQQVTSDTLTTEAGRLAAIARRSGASGVASAIRDRDASHQRAFRYLLTDKAGQHLAGDLPPSADRIGWDTISIAEPATGGDPADEPAPMKTYGLALPGGGRLVVGSDIYEVQELREWLDTVALWSGIGITFLALIAGYVIAAIFTQRLERLNTSINTIMGGRLDERVPVIGMDGEFDRLSANLNRMLDRIEELMTGVRQVSTDIAHDLRTPITRLRQHLESAITDEGVTVPRHVIEEALTQIDGIMTIFVALLRIGTIEAGAGRARFKPVDLSEIMERVLLAYQPVAEDGGKTITGAINPGILVDGDADLLAQMFTNLIENALTHTPANAAITLALHAEHDTIVAEVSDNGPGIPAAERDNVLKRFYRLNTSRTDTGAGLGLALVAAIADLHGAGLELGNVDPGLQVKLHWSTTDHH